MLSPRGERHFRSAIIGDTVLAYTFVYFHITWKLFLEDAGMLWPREQSRQQFCNCQPGIRVQAVASGVALVWL